MKAVYQLIFCNPIRHGPLDIIQVMLDPEVEICGKDLGQVHTLGQKLAS